MASVELEAIAKSFGKLEVIDGITLDIVEGEFIVFVGPSGCGKSTLLRMIAGLEDISGGRLKIDGTEMNEVPAADRGIAMVFQSYALYPHMNVRENIGFGLKMAGMPAREVADRVARAAEMLQIEELMERRPRALSGGQRQRVAIGRAIVKDPKVFLFDEPLSNLDADLRAQMRVEIARLHQSMNATMIYVTHDQVEAMTLADRIVVMRKGRIEQVGTPDELYARPANTFVAQFLGQPKMNLLSARVGGDPASPEVFVAPEVAIAILPRDAPLEPGAAIQIGIRPSDFVITSSGPNVIAGVVDIVEHLGSESLVHLRVRGIEAPIVAVAPKRIPVTSGEEIRVSVDQQEIHLFDAKGDRL